MELRFYCSDERFPREHFGESIYDVVESMSDTFYDWAINSHETGLTIGIDSNCDDDIRSTVECLKNEFKAALSIDPIWVLDRLHTDSLGVQFFGLEAEYDGYGVLWVVGGMVNETYLSEYAEFLLSEYGIEY